MPLITPSKPTLYFIGVSTGSSSIQRIFPAWADILGIPDAKLVGLDLPLQASPSSYRECVGFIRREAMARGALITSHKIDLLAASHDLFDVLDAPARALAEISCISKKDNKLLGWAKDAETSERSLGAFLPAEHWRDRPANLLLLGAGGAAVAIVWSLLQASADNRPQRILATDISPDRLKHLQGIAASLGGSIESHLVQPQEPADALLADLPPGSLVVNATGMGKDRPGSPLSDDASWPSEGFAWELNYRGERRFLQQANAAENLMHVEDGWTYFVHGWAGIVAEVFGLEISPETFKQLAKAAETFRG